MRMRLDPHTPFASRAFGVGGFAVVVVAANVVVVAARIARVAGMRAAPIKFDGLAADAPRQTCRTAWYRVTPWETPWAWAWAEEWEVARVDLSHLFRQSTSVSLKL